MAVGMFAIVVVHDRPTGAPTNPAIGIFSTQSVVKRPIAPASGAIVILSRPEGGRPERNPTVSGPGRPAHPGGPLTPLRSAHPRAARAWPRRKTTFSGWSVISRHVTRITL